MRRRRIDLAPAADRDDSAFADDAATETAAGAAGDNSAPAGSTADDLGKSRHNHSGPTGSHGNLTLDHDNADRGQPAGEHLDVGIARGGDDTTCRP